MTKDAVNYLAIMGALIILALFTAVIVMLGKETTISPLVDFKVNGTPVAQRSVVNLIQGTAIAVTASDGGVANGAEYTFNVTPGDSNSNFFQRTTTIASTMYVSGCTVACNTGSSAIKQFLTTDQIYLQPIWFDQSYSFDQFTFWVIDAGLAGQDARVGVYADNGSVGPGALRVDCGTAAVDVSAVITVTCATTTLTPGLYWLALVTEAGSATFHILPNSEMYSATNLGVPVSSPSFFHWGWSKSFTCGSGCSNPLPSSISFPFSPLSNSAGEFPIWMGISLS